MITRRTLLCVTGFAMVAVTSPLLADDEKRFTPQAFQAAQNAGRSILIEIHASWCPTCRAQKPILSELIAQPKFANMAVLRVDFDDQKETVRQFGAQMQSTLIVFRGDREVGRSVGETRRDSIAALLNKAI